MDQKSIDLVRSTIGNATNVEILNLRFDGVWGGISLVYLEVASIARLVAKSMFLNKKRAYFYRGTLESRDQFK